MPSLAVVILTYNESIHLARALSSIGAIANEVFVVDSYSSDNTVEIALSHGATVLQNKFVNQARQFQWALDNAPITSDWIMRLDADEIVEPDLSGEIARKLPILPSEVTGISLHRKLVFMNRTIKHGGRGKLTLLRIWRRGFGRVEDRWMDEHIVVQSGRILTLNGGFSDHNLHNLSAFIEKHNKYATREAVDVLNRELGFIASPEQLSVETTAFQAVAKRYIKENIYNTIPFELSAFAYFVYRYVFRLGFLDGTEGLIYNVLQGFWYRFLVGAKVRELRNITNGEEDPASIRMKLQDFTGLSFTPATKLVSNTSA